MILGPEPDTERPAHQLEEQVGIVQDIIQFQEYLKLAQPSSFLRRKLINPNIIEMVAKATVGQRNNSLWCAIRKLRFTASNFGRILSAVKSGRSC